MKRNDYNEDDLKKKLKCKKPILLRISSDVIEPKRYESLSEATGAIGVPIQTLMYAFERRRPMITRRKGGIKSFNIEWL